MASRETIKSLIPPVVLELRRRLLGSSLRFSEWPLGWDEAVAASTGYSTDDILRRVVGATRAVLSGQARYERDSVLFDDRDYSFGVLAAVLRAAAMNGGNANVIDFGGSLGSTYRQCRSFIGGAASVHWCVVEQAAFVKIGRSEFATAELSFEESVASVPNVTRDSLILASSVLQYIKDPYAILEDLNRLPARHLVIDRTPLSDCPSDRLFIQHVPKHIYNASYPCWIMSRAGFLAHLSHRWSVVADFPSDVAWRAGQMRSDDGMNFEYRGLILEKLPASPPAVSEEARS